MRAIEGNPHRQTDSKMELRCQVNNDHRALRDPGLNGRLTDDGALPESTLSMHQQPAGAVGKRRLNPRNLVYPVGQIHASCRVPDDERVFDDLGQKQG